MLPTQNIDLLLKDLEENKVMALFLGSGVDVNYRYPGLEWVKNGKDVDRDPTGISEKKQKRLYFKYRTRIENSQDYVMNWNTLLKELTDYALLSEEEEKALNGGGFDSPMRAAILKYKLGNSYIPVIKNWLYSRCNRDMLEDSLPYFLEYKKNPTLEKLKIVPFATHFVLAELILKKRCIRAVFTQNYNNFITEAINLLLEYQTSADNYRDIHPIDVYDGWKDEAYTDNCLLIYHVHGYIPSPSEMNPKDESNHIVLTYDEFNDLSKSVYSWQNASQLHFFTHHTCVLWGLSMNDLTSLRLLRHANLERSSEKVYWLRGGRDDGDSQEIMASNMLKAHYFDSQHVHTVNDENGYNSLYHKIMKEVIPLPNID